MSKQLPDRWISVPNWRRFQHYTDRNPPWIKNYTELLSDEDYLTLSPHRRAVLHGVWLVYASEKAREKLTVRSLARRLNMKVTTSDIDTLTSAGWLELTDRPADDGPQWASRYVSKRLRARILEKADHRCVLCGESEDLEVDHVVPVSKGGTGDEQNLRVLCRRCNRQLHNTGAVLHQSSGGLASVSDQSTPETETETEKEQQHELRNRSEYAATAQKDDKTDNNLERRLALAGWNRDQRAQAQTDPARAQAWLEADTTRTASKPGAYAWAGFQSGDWPARGVTPRKTGWRAVRGTHSGTHVPDPDGTDTPPRLASDRPSP